MAKKISAFFFFAESDMAGRRQKCTPHLLYTLKQHKIMTSGISEKKSLRNNKDGKARALPKMFFSVFFCVVVSRGDTLVRSPREKDKSGHMAKNRAKVESIVGRWEKGGRREK